MDTVLEEIYNGHNIQIFYDYEPENPIENWDMLGNFASFHRRYNLSSSTVQTSTDKHDKYNYRFDSPDELNKLVNRKDVISLPLYLYDHSGITIKTSPFSCPWDSGQIGYIFVEVKNAVAFFNRKRLSKKLRERILNVLESNVEVFDQYLTGQVYGYKIIDENDNEIDACWSIYNEPEEILKECKSIIDNIEV